MQHGRAMDLLGRFHRARIVVLGDVMLDRYVYGFVERISPEAPIPVLAVSRTANMPGGAANVARNIAALGGHCTLIGVVGDDEIALELRTQLASASAIEVAFVSDVSRPTSLKTRFVADGQQVMRADSEQTRDISTDISAQLLSRLEAALANADVLILSDYAKGVLSDVVIRRAIEMCRCESRPVIVDPKSDDFSRYRGATVLTPNCAELRRACGVPCATDEEIVRGGESLLRNEICEALVVTRGHAGMSVIESNRRVTHLPTMARRVFDVSGAGDTVAAVLGLGIASGASLATSASLANLAAGVVVGKRGTATATAAEVLDAALTMESPRHGSKRYRLNDVATRVREWRDRGLRIAFTNGCFDLLHPGHISLLEQARRSADRLVVGVNADVSVKRIKGAARPVQSEEARATVLAALSCVDAVVIFSADTPLELIKELKPDVLVKGSDYRIETVIGASEVMSYGGRVLLADFLEGHGTTETFRRFAKSASAGGAAKT